MDRGKRLEFEVGEFRCQIDPAIEIIWDVAVSKAAELAASLRSILEAQDIR